MPDQEPPRRRATSRGWNIQRSGTRWRVRVSDPHTAARESKTFDTKADAAGWAETRRSQFILHQATASRFPFDELAKEYMDDVRRRCRSADHIEEVQRIVDMVREAGVKNLAAPGVVPLISSLIANLKTRAGLKASPKTRNNALTKIKAIANFAVRRDYLIKNPFMSLKKERAPVKDKPVFTLDELGRLVDPSRSAHPFYKPFCCMLYTGFRQGEMRHLQWDWFLWEDERIVVRFSDDFITKSGRERITRLMHELKEIMQPEGDMRGPVFPELIHADRALVKQRFESFLWHCDVPIDGRTPHSCRHTWTSLMLASGENQILVQQYAGHDDKAMTGHYAKQQDFYLARVRQAGWERGQLRLRDFSPGGSCYRTVTGAVVGHIPPAVGG